MRKFLWLGLAIVAILALVFNAGNWQQKLGHLLLANATTQAAVLDDEAIDASDAVTETRQTEDFVTREEYEADQKEVDERLKAVEEALKKLTNRVTTLEVYQGVSEQEHKRLVQRVDAAEKMLENAATKAEVLEAAKMIENLDRLVQARIDAAIEKIQARCACDPIIPARIGRVADFCQQCAPTKVQPAPNQPIQVIHQPTAAPSVVVIQPPPPANGGGGNGGAGGGGGGGSTFEVGDISFDLTDMVKIELWLSMWSTQSTYDPRSQQLFCQLCLMEEVWPFCVQRFPAEAQACRTLATAFPDNTATPGPWPTQPWPTPRPSQTPHPTPDNTPAPPTVTPVPTVPTPTQPPATLPPPPPQNCVDGYPLAGEIDEAYDRSNNSRYPAQDHQWTCDGRWWAFRQPVNSQPFTVAFKIMPNFTYTVNMNLCKICIDENRNSQGCGNPSQTPKNDEPFTVTTGGGAAYGVMECDGHRDAGGEIRVTNDTAPPSRPTPGHQECQGGRRPTQYWARMNSGNATPPEYYAQWDCDGGRLWMPAWGNVRDDEKLCFSISGMPLPAGFWRFNGSEMDLYVNGEWRAGGGNTQDLLITSDATIEVRTRFCNPDGTNRALGFEILKLNQ